MRYVHQTVTGQWEPPDVERLAGRDGGKTNNDHDVENGGPDDCPKALAAARDEGGNDSSKELRSRRSCGHEGGACDVLGAGRGGKGRWGIL